MQFSRKHFVPAQKNPKASFPKKHSLRHTRDTSGEELSFPKFQFEKRLRVDLLESASTKEKLLHQGIQEEE